MFLAIPEGIGSPWKSSAITLQSGWSFPNWAGQGTLCWVGKLDPTPICAIRNQALQNLSESVGCNLSQNLEQMAEGKAVLTAVHSSNTGHAFVLLQNQFWNRKEIVYELHYSCLTCSQPVRFWHPLLTLPLRIWAVGITHETITVVFLWFSSPCFAASKTSLL